MKRLVIFTVLSMLIALLIYGMTAFVVMDSNPAKWTIDQRGGSAALMFFGFFFAAVGTGIITNND